MEAYLYKKLDSKKVQCNICNHRCIIKPGSRGICNVRENVDGILNSLVFNKIVAENVDPVEKKPLYHFHPGTLSYSVSTVGCNLKCKFCQNSDIAQMPADRNGLIHGRSTTPKSVVDAAEKAGCKTISYTYTEPSVYFELAYEIAKIATERDIKNIFVTNGYMTPEALNMISPYLDGANVDLKAYNDKFYKELCQAKLSFVKESLIQMKKLNIFVEITTLLIPGLNDDYSELKELADFIVNSLGSDTPWHISRFHPSYKLMDVNPTPVETLDKARTIGIESGLKYVYIGNVYNHEGENTFCYNCNKLLIERTGFNVNNNIINDGFCPDCNSKIDGVGL